MRSTYNIQIPDDGRKLCAICRSHFTGKRTDKCSTCLNDLSLKLNSESLDLSKVINELSKNLETISKEVITGKETVGKEEFKEKASKIRRRNKETKSTELPELRLKDKEFLHNYFFQYKIQLEDIVKYCKGKNQTLGKFISDLKSKIKQLDEYEYKYSAGKMVKIRVNDLIKRFYLCPKKKEPFEYIDLFHILLDDYLEKFKQCEQKCEVKLIKIDDLRRTLKDDLGRTLKKRKRNHSCSDTQENTTSSVDLKKNIDKTEQIVDENSETQKSNFTDEISFVYEEDASLNRGETTFTVKNNASKIPLPSIINVYEANKNVEVDPREEVYRAFINIESNFHKPSTLNGSEVKKDLVSAKFRDKTPMILSADQNYKNRQKEINTEEINKNNALCKEDKQSEKLSNRQKEIVEININDSLSKVFKDTMHEKTDCVSVIQGDVSSSIISVSQNDKHRENEKKPKNFNEDNNFSNTVYANENLLENSANNYANMKNDGSILSEDTDLTKHHIHNSENTKSDNIMLLRNELISRFMSIEPKSDQRGENKSSENDILISSDQSNENIQRKRKREDVNDLGNRAEECRSGRNKEKRRKQDDFNHLHSKGANESLSIDETNNLIGSISDVTKCTPSLISTQNDIARQSLISTNNYVQDGNASLTITSISDCQSFNKDSALSIKDIDIESNYFLNAIALNSDVTLSILCPGDQSFSVNEVKISIEKEEHNLISKFTPGENNEAYKKFYEFVFNFKKPGSPLIYRNKKISQRIGHVGHCVGSPSVINRYEISNVTGAKLMPFIKNRLDFLKKNWSRVREYLDSTQKKPLLKMSDLRTFSRPKHKRTWKEELDSEKLEDKQSQLLRFIGPIDNDSVEQLLHAAQEFINLKFKSSTQPPFILTSDDDVQDTQKEEYQNGNSDVTQDQNKYMFTGYLDDDNQPELQEEELAKALGIQFDTEDQSKMSFTDFGRCLGNDSEDGFPEDMEEIFGEIGGDLKNKSSIEDLLEAFNLDDDSKDSFKSEDLHTPSAVEALEVHNYAKVSPELNKTTDPQDSVSPSCSSGTNYFCSNSSLKFGRTSFNNDRNLHNRETTSHDPDSTSSSFGTNDFCSDSSLKFHGTSFNNDRNPRRNLHNRETTSQDPDSTSIGFDLISSLPPEVWDTFLKSLPKVII